MVFVLGTTSFQKSFLIFPYSRNFVGFCFTSTVSQEREVLWSIGKKAINFFSLVCTWVEHRFRANFFMHFFSFCLYLPFFLVVLFDICWSMKDFNCPLWRFRVISQRIQLVYKVSNQPDIISFQKKQRIF